MYGFIMQLYAKCFYMHLKAQEEDMYLYSVGYIEGLSGDGKFIKQKEVFISAMLYMVTHPPLIHKTTCKSTKNKYTQQSDTRNMETYFIQYNPRCNT